MVDNGLSRMQKGLTMADSQTIAKWEQIAAHLRALIALFEVGPDGAAKVELFIEANELGLALESLSHEVGV